MWTKPTHAFYKINTKLYTSQLSIFELGFLEVCHTKVFFFFSWRLLWGKLLTKSTLNGIRVILPSLSCALCDNEFEDITHFIFNVWFCSCCLDECAMMHSNQIYEHYVWHDLCFRGKHVKKMKFIIRHATCFSLWIQHNNVILNDGNLAIVLF